MLATLLLFALATPAAGFWDYFGLAECRYSKEDCKECAMAKVDFDQDGRISREEVAFVFEKILLGAARASALAFTSPDIAIVHCGDVDTGFITEETFEASSACIKKCFEKVMFQNLVCAKLDSPEKISATRVAFAEWREARNQEVE